MSKRQGRKAKKLAAFSLAEIILSLGLCVVAVLSAIALGISASQSNQKLTDQAIATGLANQEMNQLIYALPASTDPFWNLTTFGSPYESDTVQLGRMPFQVSIFLQDLSSMGSGMRMALVNVSWDSGVQGRTGYGMQSVQASRLIYAH